MLEKELQRVWAALGFGGVCFGRRMLAIVTSYLCDLRVLRGKTCKLGVANN